MNKFFKVAMLVLTLAIASDQSASAAGGRKFYLTKTSSFTGAQALTACAKGYHMASLFEILDVSNLRYDTTLGHVVDDSGFGPPAGFSLDPNEGWVRTGTVENGVDLGGFANCFAWTSDLSGDFGTSVGLALSFWSDTGSIVSPWTALTSHCSFEKRVWCVQD